MSKKLYHGAAFYPELWNKEIYIDDIKKMKETGINVARIGEFLWSRIEPEEGKIDVSFLVEVIKLLNENGIDTVISTPTVTPPIWMTHEHPERLHVDDKGVLMHHGSRQHMCTNNPYYRERSKIIIEHISKAVGNLPGVILWQLDNEFKSHISECMCSECKKQWHEWLEKRYGTIENLNKKWGAEIWSEEYRSFEQVPQPVSTPFLHNSSLSTMYRLFTREKIAEFADMQIEAIRKYSSLPITTNGSIGFFIDNERMYKNLDVASYDTYAGSDNYRAYVINTDLWRNVKKGKDFWLIETSTSHTGALDTNPGVHPKGYLKVEAVSCYALGGEAFCYWLWRQQHSGCELTHGSVLSAWGKPTIGYNEVLEVEETRKAIEPIITASNLYQAELAITYSDRAKAFLLTETHKKLEYRGLFGRFYNTILDTGIHRDIILEGTSLAGYKILMTPFMHYVSDEFLARAKDFMEKGGIWIAGPLTGGRTEEHTIHTDAGLGKLDELAGVETAFTYPMDGTGAIGTAFGVSAELGLWSSVFRPIDAKVVGKIEGGRTPECAFITERTIGKGKMVLVGSMPMGEDGEKLIQAMAIYYAKEVGIVHMTDVTVGTIVAPRNYNGNLVWVIVNMDGNGGSITLPSAAIDIVNNIPLEKGVLNIGRYEYRVVKFNG